MTPFQKIPDACRTTGLSMYYLCKGCKDGTIPHIKRSDRIYHQQGNQEKGLLRFKVVRQQERPICGILHFMT